MVRHSREGGKPDLCPGGDSGSPAFAGMTDDGGYLLSFSSSRVRAANWRMAMR